MDIAERARELEGDDRETYLARECDGTDHLRALVEPLLADSDDTTDVLSGPLVDLGLLDEQDQFIARMIGRQVGGYTIRSLIDDRGGMGFVFEAAQMHPHRLVALKMLKGNVPSRTAVQRFKAEADKLARLRHPGIAQVYQSGALDEGAGRTLYFTMELIPSARSLIDYADVHDLSTRKRIELFCEVCDAVQHIHERGIIHRDLKPSNILVAPEGHPKIIDFGVARTSDADVAQTSDRTLAGGLVGTPRYMSPEQIRGDTVTARSDIYTLGVVLYELLVGELPYQATTFSDTKEAVLHTPPRPPSIVNRRVRGDLETVILKALSKEHEDRYESAAAIRNDLKLYLAGFPVTARRRGVLDHMWAMVRRHPVVAAGVVVAIGLSVVVAIAMERQATQRAAAEFAAKRLAQAHLLASATAAIEGGDPGAALISLQRIEQDQRGWEWRLLWGLLDDSIEVLAQSDIMDAAHRWTDMAASVDGSVVAALRQSGEIRVWLAGEGTATELMTDTVEVGRSGLDKPTSIAMAVDASSQRRWVAVAGQDEAATGLASVFEIVGSRLEHRGTVRKPVSFTAIAIDGNRGVLAVGTSRSVHLYEGLDTLRPTETFRDLDGAISDLAFDAAGRRLAAACADRTARVWDLTDPIGPPLVLRGHLGKVRAVAFSRRDSELLATASTDATVRLWDLRASEEQKRAMQAAGQADSVTGIVRETLHAGPGALTSLAFNPEGDRLAAGGLDGRILLWEFDHELWETPSLDRSWTIKQARALAPMRGHAHRVTGVAFLEGMLVSCSTDRTVRQWPAEPLPPVPTLVGHSSGVHAVVHWAHPDRGPLVISGSGDRSIMIWDAVTGDLLVRLPEPHQVARLGLAPDRRKLFAGLLNGTVSVWDLSDPVEPKHLKRRVLFQDERLSTLALGPTKDRLIAGGFRGTVKLWTFGDDRIQTLLDASAPVNDVCFSPDGTRAAVATGDPDGPREPAMAWVLDLAHDSRYGLPHEAAVTAAAFIDGGHRLVTGDADGRLHLWELGPRSADRHASFYAHSQRVRVIRVDGDARRLATGSWDSTISLWDLDGGSILHTLTLRGQRANIEDLCFSADGQVLASALVGHWGGNSVKLWQPSDTTVRRRRAAAQAERQRAARLLPALFNELGTAAAVRERIERDVTLEPGVRKAAIRLIEASGDRGVHYRIWAAVLDRDRARREYDVFRQQARMMQPPYPEEFRVDLTRGMAAYRVGDLDAAVVSLERARKDIDEAKRPSSIWLPAADAALAMTLHRLGRVSAAEDHLREAAATIDAGGGRAHYPLADAVVLFDEASELLAKPPS